MSVLRKHAAQVPPLSPAPRCPHMSHFTILGGMPLGGTVEAGGSKNAVLPMMAAAILAGGPVELRRVPQLADVRTMALVLEDLGLEISRTGDRLRLETFDPRPRSAPAGGWFAACGPVSACWGRCWRGVVGRWCRCPAAATSATARWTCT